MMLNLKRIIYCFINNVKGVAYIEFALVLPLLMMLFAGGVELTNFIQTNQKVDSAAVQLANFISQQDSPENVNYTKMSNKVFKDLITPFSLKNASFVVSGVSPDLSNTATDGDLVIDWQEARGASINSSRIGGIGEIPVDNINMLNVRNSESLVVVEVFYKYKNIIPAIDSFTQSKVFNFSDGRPLYQRSVMRYRLAGISPQNGAVQITFYPNCCGKYCTGAVPPVCACDPAGGTTNDPSIAAKYPSCTYIATCKNGGISGPILCPTCANGGITDPKKCNPTCENGGITNPAICNPDPCDAPGASASNPSCPATCKNKGLSGPDDCPTCANGGITDPKRCNPTCANGGITDPKKCNPTCENGGLTSIADCLPAGS